MAESHEDGRVARGQRTREAVIDALLALYAEGNLTPTIEDVADRIGRTARSVYHHFRDKEAIAVAIADRQLRLHGELFTARPIDGTRTERIAGIAAHRAELFETVAPARRSALVRMHLSPELQRQQTSLAAHLRGQLAQTFVAELEARAADDAELTLDLLDLHASWETWERLRSWQRLSVDRSRAIVEMLLTAALSDH